MRLWEERCLGVRQTPPNNYILTRDNIRLHKAHRQSQQRDHRRVGAYLSRLHRECHKTHQHDRTLPILMVTEHLPDLINNITLRPCMASASHMNKKRLITVPMDQAITRVLIQSWMSQRHKHSRKMYIVTVK